MDGMGWWRSSFRNRDMPLIASAPASESIDGNLHDWGLFFLVGWTLEFAAP